VLGFTPAAIIKAFDEELTAREKRNPNFSPKAPILLRLIPSGAARQHTKD
jgi:hypothetical protein